MHFILYFVEVCAIRTQFSACDASHEVYNFIKLGDYHIYVSVEVKVFMYHDESLFLVFFALAASFV